MSRLEFLRKFFDARKIFLPQTELEALDAAITEYDATRLDTTPQIETNESLSVTGHDYFQYPLHITNPLPYEISTTAPTTSMSTALPLTNHTTALPVSYDTKHPHSTVASFASTRR
jgi:hypothetical protein